jgi:hypothetical protein
MASVEAVDPAVGPEPEQVLAGRLRARIERLELLERAVHRIGIQDWNGTMVDLVARQAEAACMACVHTVECRRWLDGTTRGAARLDAWRSFCPNVALFSPLADAALRSSPRASDGAGSRMGRLRRRAAAALEAWRRGAAAGGPNDDAYCPSVDDLRRMRDEALRREARALLDARFLH